MVIDFDFAWIAYSTPLASMELLDSNHELSFTLLELNINQFVLAVVSRLNSSSEYFRFRCFGY